MEAEAQDKAPEITQAPDLVTFYANGARIVQSEYDVRIYFSEQVSPPRADSAGQSTAVEKVCIIMAPKFAEEFHVLFSSLGGPKGDQSEIDSYR